MPTVASARPRPAASSVFAGLAPVIPPMVAKARTKSAKYSAGPKWIANLHQQRREQHQADGRDESADEGGDAGDRQRLGRLALLRHRIAVEAGHHRRLVAGDVQHDRRDAPAVHAAVIDAGEQDQRGARRQLQREGQRDQDRHAVDRAEAGQRADDGADEAAEQRQPDIRSASAPRRSRSAGSPEFPRAHLLGAARARDSAEDRARSAGGSPKTQSNRKNSPKPMIAAIRLCSQVPPRMRARSAAPGSSTAESPTARSPADRRTSTASIAIWPRHAASGTRPDRDPAAGSGTSEQPDRAPRPCAETGWGRRDRRRPTL